jgi:hypothetical protein
MPTLHDHDSPRSGRPQGYSPQDTLVLFPMNRSGTSGIFIHSSHATLARWSPSTLSDRWLIWRHASGKGVSHSFSP